MIAALYVAPRGIYYGLPHVEPWGLPERDARLYPGPHPVVAHPPCARWCRLAGLVEARYPHLRRGEDDGCFEAALRSVRTWGGVLEHPAYTDAWPAFGLPAPRSHGWQGGLCGGWTAEVAQLHYGHRARKATWLYVYGVAAENLPELRWGLPLAASSSPCAGEIVERERERESRMKQLERGRSPWGVASRKDLAEGRKSGSALISYAANHVSEWEDRPRLSKREASATPVAFRDLLIGIAESVWKERDAA